MTEIHCGNCHRVLPEGYHPYTMRIELFPRVEDSLRITAEDLEIDFDAEIKRIVSKLEAMSEDERQLEEERVYSRFHFALCVECRDFLARQLKEGQKSSP